MSIIELSKTIHLIACGNSLLEVPYFLEEDLIVLIGTYFCISNSQELSNVVVDYENLDCCCIVRSMVWEILDYLRFP